MPYIVLLYIWRWLILCQKPLNLCIDGQCTIELYESIKYIIIISHVEFGNWSCHSSQTEIFSEYLFFEKKKNLPKVNWGKGGGLMFGYTHLAPEPHRNYVISQCYSRVYTSVSVNFSITNLTWSQGVGGGGGRRYTLTERERCGKSICAPEECYFQFPYVTERAERERGISNARGYPSLSHKLCI